MSTARVTRSSVLGKRSHQSSPPCDRIVSHTPLTPERSPDAKRPRVSITVLDGDSNKENVPPFRLESPSDSSPTTPRTVRRASTEIVTPSRPRTRSRKHASFSELATPATPTRAIARLILATPPPTPPSILPVHVRARALLRPISNGGGHIAGREKESDQIRDFIKSFLQHEAHAGGAKTLYISGSPGTGKTALVDSIIRGFEQDETSAKIISINCMALQSIDTLWERLAEELSPSKKHTINGKAKKIRGRKEVDVLLSRLPIKCILVLDELDNVAASFQSLVSIFSLPQSNESCLRIIGIANTHTLTSSTSQFSSHGVNGVNTVHFSPYTSPQLLAILQARLEPLYENQLDTEITDQAKKLLPAPTLTLLSKKIAAQSGDVRVLFEVLRNAIDIAIASPSRSNPLYASASVVSPSHILSALKAYVPATNTMLPSVFPFSVRGPVEKACNSEIVTKVRNLGFQARLILLSLLLASKRLEAGLSLASPTVPKSPIKRAHSVHNAPTSQGYVGIDIAQLHAYYSSFLSKTENEIFTPVSRSEMGDLVGILETVGLARLSTSFPARSASPSKAGRRSFGRTASFGGGGKGQDRGQEVGLVEGVRCGEVLRGLGIVGETKDKVGTDIREEEVRAIWEREKATLSKDVKASTRAGLGLELENLFDGATED